MCLQNDERQRDNLHRVLLCVFLCFFDSQLTQSYLFSRLTCFLNPKPCPLAHCTQQASATTSSSKGGKSSSSNSSWVGTWVQLASAALPSPRCGHVAVWWPSRFSAHSEADEELQATSSSFSHGSSGSLVLFGGTDGAGLPKGLLVLEESPASSSGGKKDEKAKDMYWRAEALPLEGRLSAAAGATLMRRGERDGNALLVFGGVTAAADSADSYLIEPPN